MIVKEKFKIRADGVQLIRTTSDSGVLIRKVGTEHVDEEFIDVEGAAFEYVETDEKIKGD